MHYRVLRLTCKVRRSTPTISTCSPTSIVSALDRAFQYSSLTRTTPFGARSSVTSPFRPIMPSEPVFIFLWKAGITNLCIIKTVATKKSIKKMIIGKDIDILRNRRTNRTSKTIARSSNSETKTMSQSLILLFISYAKMD